MASFLRPRRGKKSTATNTLTSSNPLKRGEIFFEVPDGGVGTGQGRLFMGDGSTAYGSLTPFLSIPDATIPSFASAQSTDAARLAKITTGVKFSELFSNLKALLTSLDSRITSLNNDLYAPLVTHQTITFSRTVSASTWTKGTSHSLSYESNISVPSGYTISSIVAQSGSPDYIVSLSRETDNGEHKIIFYITTKSVSSIRAYIVIQFVKSNCFS